MTEKLNVCPACGAKISNDDIVYVSYGKPMDRTKLATKVCQYAKKTGCINKDTAPDINKDFNIQGFLTDAQRLDICNFLQNNLLD